MPLLQEAQTELMHSADYYGTTNPQLAERFLGVMRAAIDLAAEAPLRFPLIEENVRRVLVPVFPYAALYSLEEEGINVLAVMHCARKPGYWKMRL